MANISHPQPGATANAWRRRADELAAWAMAHLVNRNNAYGRYLPIAHRSKKRAVETRRGPLTLSVLRQHFVAEDPGHLIGLHTTSPSGNCRWIAIDIDHHGPPDQAAQYFNRAAAIELYNRVKSFGFDPLLLSSNGRGGYHLLVRFNAPVPSTTSYRFAKWLVRDWQELQLDAEPETFPKQHKLSGKCKFGNWLRLPGRHHTLNWHSRVWSGKRWLADNKAVDTILATVGTSAHAIPTAAFCHYLPELDPKPAQSASPRRATRGTTQRPIRIVLERLARVRPCGDQWSAQCPSHADSDNSLSVGETPDGTVLIYCHAECDVERIVKTLGLKMRDLFPSRRRTRQRPLRRSRT